MTEASTRSCPDTVEASYRDAIDEALVVRHLGVAEGNARAELNQILSWEVAVALDPRVSEAAQDLIEQGTRTVAQARQVPDGYVIMPREATRVMTIAGCDSLPSCEHVFGHAGEMLANAYRKMVEVCGHISVSSTDSPAQTASEQSILLDLAAKFRKEHSSVFSGNNVATALAEAASALPSTQQHTLPGHKETMAALNSLTIRSEDCSCVGAVIGQHDRSCPYAHSSPSGDTP